jgi:predicted ATPase/class 3 adenylate cyclase
VAELPTGTVTFLFTDLEGSTRLWEQHSTAMKAALARHDEILRNAVEAHGGHVVKTTGDGFHAVFGAAEGAVDAAVEAQRGLSSEAWSETGPLRVRMGIHSGPAEVRDADYYGSTLNRAARLMSAAHGGQVVVSLATEELVPAGSVEFLDLGEHALRDLARPEQVFQVAHPDLERDFPRLASLDAFVGNLPLQVTSFVGRDADVARIVGVLDDVSLVTLTGTGGVGKTRLAVQVAAELLPRFADGAWFCELAAAEDAETMAQVVATTLGCRQHPGLSLVESVVEYLRFRELLLVLDNCEQLLDDAGALADEVLHACPHVMVLATSREALDVPGERVVRVRSLDPPAPSATSDELAHSAAVRLFGDRSADAGVETAWDERQWAAVGEICRRVDGIPLAIELAAARTASMSPIDIASHLDERFRLLTGKRRGRVERHQTLRATVEWSYQLLDRDERTVFERLGVFAGSFDGPAAGAVAGTDGLDTWEVTDALSRLVAKSMLGAETGPDGTTRYALNETLRQFARERLDEAGETDRWRRAHAEYYASWAHDAGYGLTGPDDLRWMARLRAEIDNIRAAVGWSLDRDNAEERELGLRILAFLVEARGQVGLGLGAVAAQAVWAAEESRAELRVPVLAIAAYHEWYQGEVERARALAQAAMQDGVMATTVNPLAPHGGAVTFEMTAGNDARALEITDHTLASLDSLNNPYAQTWILAGTATFDAMAGRFDRARSNAEQAMTRARQSGNRNLLASAYHGSAWALQRDDPAAALAAAEHYIDLHRQFDISHHAATSAVMALAGGLRARLGDNTGALEVLHEAVLVARDQGARPQLAAALDWALSPLRRAGQPGTAATFLGALTRGALAGVGNFPGVDNARARTLDGIRAGLGDEKTDELVNQGAAMSYDELVQYAIQNLAQHDTHGLSATPAGGA